MKRKNLLIFLLMLARISVANAQYEVPLSVLELIGHTSSSMVEPEINNNQQLDYSCAKTSAFYDATSFYMINSNSVEKTIKVNFVIIQKDDSTGNFQENDPEHMQMFEDLETALNWRFANLNPNNCELDNIDTKLRFDCTPVFIRNSNLWGVSPNLYVLSNTLENTPGYSKGINIFFTITNSAYTKYIINNSCDWTESGIMSASFVDENNLNATSYIRATDLLPKFHWMKNCAPSIYEEPWDPTIYGWFIGSVMAAFAHELGHDLWLLDIVVPQNACDSINIMRQQASERKYLTDEQICRMHRSLAITNVRKYVIDATPLDAPLIITGSDEIIDFNVRLYRDIIIKSGAKLTITCTVLMPSTGRIFVEPGGILVIDGGVLTNGYPGKSWYGIHVAGNSNLSQTPQNQGTVELYDATIENARFAIMTYGLTANGNPDYSTTGGIIKAENTKFINNRKSAVFWAYPTNDVIVIPQNVSYFKNCEFIVDDDNLFESSGFDFESHISMWGVTGVKINGCTFKNDMIKSSERYQAIYTESAGYIIDEDCPQYNNTISGDNCDCRISPTPSVFAGFNKAIQSSGSGSQYYIRIDRSNFSDNIRGIDISGMSNFKIQRLNMNVGSSFSQSSTGIYLDNTTGYNIEGDTIYSDGSDKNTGICINNAGTNENRIYKNEIYDIGTAISVTEQSSIIIQRALPATGLQFVCNDMYDNINDIYVGSAAKVRATQGGANAGADNLFSHDNNNDYHFYMASPSNGNVNYYFNNAITRKRPVNKTNNIVLNNASANPCSSTLCISQDSLIIVDKSQKSDLSEYSELNNKYSEMMSYFYAKAYDKVILDYYNGIIEDEKLLEEAMAYHEEILSLTSYMALLSDNALFELKSDSIIDLSQIRDWYDEIYTLSAKYSLAETYYQMGKYDEGFGALSKIPKNFKLDEREKIEYENYLSLFTFKNDVRKSGRTIAELNEDEIEKLIEIAKATPDLSSAMAKGILCFFYGICIETAVETHGRVSLPASIDYSSNERLSNHVSNNNIYIYPNPGNDNITVITQMENCLFEMYSANGSKHISVQLEKGSNNINTSSLKRGVYIYRVETGQCPVYTDVVSGKWVKM